MDATSFIVGLIAIGGIGFGLHRAGYLALPISNSEVDAPPQISDDFGFDGYEFEQNFDGKTRFSVENMTISQDAVNFIKGKEGFSSTPYRDAKGVWTIGYGTTRGVNHTSGPVSQNEAEIMMREDLEGFHYDLVRLVNVPLSQNEYDALMSFIYNIGAKQFASSTLRRRLNEGDYQAAAEQFSRWIYSGGQQLRGLVIRRNEEMQRFLA